MTISKTHVQFARLVNNIKALSRPQDFLGPNTDQLIKFWSFLDTLTEEQWETVGSRYLDFFNNQHSEWDKANDEALSASNETIGRELANYAADAVEYVYHWTAYDATWEIIGGIENPVFLKMFDDL